MSGFEFAGIDGEGRRKRGRIEAESRDGALAALRAAGLRVTDIAPAGEALPFWKRDLLGGERPRRKDVLSFFQDLSALLGANLPVDRALRLCLRQAGSRMRPVLHDLVEAVVAGRALSDALRAREDVFPRTAVEIIRAGELTGMLGTVSGRVADMLRRQEEVRGAVTSALIYPALLTVMAMVIVVIVVCSLLPSIAPLFDAPGVVPPLPIRALRFGEMLVGEHGPLLLAAAFAGLAAGLLWWFHPAVKAWRNVAWRRLPLIGPLLVEMDVGQTCRVLGTLVAARVPLPRALAVAENIPAGLGFRRALSDARRSIQEGARLADALHPLSASAPQMIDMIRTGEEVNRLDEMLLRLADLSEYGVKTRIDRMFTLLTPAITCIMGLVIGGLIMTIMSAILSVNDLAATP